MRLLGFAILVGVVFAARGWASAEPYSVQYWADNTPQPLSARATATPAGTPAHDLQTLPLVQTGPSALRLGDATYVLDGEGLYRVWSGQSKVVRQSILYRGNVWRLAGHLSRLYVYGTRHNGDDPAKWDERALHGEPVSIQCGNIASFVISHLAEQKIASRPVSCVTGSDWNHFDDGHALMEICDPAEKRWILFDPTLGARYRHAGKWLDLLELTRLYRSPVPPEIDFVNASSKVDPLMDYEAFWAPGYPDKTTRKARSAAFVQLLENNQQAIHRWYGRVMQVPLIGNHFVPENDAEDALLRTLPCWKDLVRLSPEQFRQQFYGQPCAK